jgi:hypothetical protein
MEVTLAESITDADGPADSFSVAAIPEPSSALLLGVTASSLLLRRRNHRKTGRMN